MRFKALAVELASLMFAVAVSGCAILKPPVEEAVRATPPAPPAKPVPWTVSQTDGVRDLISGDRLHVFCRGDECAKTVKTVTVPSPVKVAPPRPSPAPAAERKPDPVVLQLPFSYNKAKLGKEALDVLKAHAEKVLSAKKVRVVGMADSVKNDAFNLALAKRRADTVVRWLNVQKKKSASNVEIEVDTRLVRVTSDGQYPNGEAYSGRRVDMSVLIVEVQ